MMQTHFVLDVSSGTNKKTSAIAKQIEGMDYVLYRYGPVDNLFRIIATARGNT